LAINQSKLSGQCGRLKCCLNFELNTYLDALKEFPKNVENLETQKGNAFLLKTDIFKRIMFFAYRKEFGALDVYPLSVDRVKEIAAMNRQGKKPEDLLEEGVEKSSRGKREKGSGDEFVDGAGSLELSQLEDKRRRNKKKRGNERNQQSAAEINKDLQNQKKEQQPNNQNKPEQKNFHKDNHRNKKPKQNQPISDAGNPQSDDQEKSVDSNEQKIHKKHKHHHKNKKFNPQKKGGQNPNNEKKDNQ
jgi:hypothetical protein